MSRDPKQSVTVSSDLYELITQRAAALGITRKSLVTKALIPVEQAVIANKSLRG